MKRQDVHALFPLNRIDTNHGRLAREFDRRNDRIEFGHIQIAFELFTGLPFLDEQQCLALVQIRIEAGIQATGATRVGPSIDPRVRNNAVRRSSGATICIENTIKIYVFRSSAAESELSLRSCSLSQEAGQHRGRDV